MNGRGREKEWKRRGKSVKGNGSGKEKKRETRRNAEAGSRERKGPAAAWHVACSIKKRPRRVDVAAVAEEKGEDDLGGSV